MVRMLIDYIFLLTIVLFILEHLLCPLNICNLVLLHLSANFCVLFFFFGFLMEYTLSRDDEFILLSKIGITVCCQFLGYMYEIISMKYTKMHTNENINREKSAKIGQKIRPIWVRMKKLSRNSPKEYP